MARIACALSVAAVLMGMPARGQTPQQHLEEARRLLREIPTAAGGGAASPRVAALQQDFNEFASDYLMQNAHAAAPEVPEASADRQSDWRGRYLRVETDLSALLGPPDTANTTGPGLDPAMRERLQQVRRHLQTFYAATIQSRDGNPVAHTGPAPNQPAPAAPTTAAPQTTPPVPVRADAPDPASARSRGAAQQPPPPGGSVPANPPIAPPAPAPTTPAPQPSAPMTASCPPAAAGMDLSTSLQLLDRISAILDAAAQADSPTSLTPAGTSGTKDRRSAAAGARVTLDRSLVDEMRAEVRQIRALLKQ